jgi:osmotically-inducible protein OsmY
LKEDHRVIDQTAATSERLADKTAAQTPNARDHATPPAGIPKSTESADTDQSNAEPQRSADNTAKNERDRDDATLTPTDQSNAPNDLELSAKIRRAIVGADGLSFTARNVKIITENGHVTLRGPVANAAEKSRVEETARRAAGSARVVSQLEIEK